MLFNKSALIVVLATAIASVTAAATPTAAAPEPTFTGVATHFDHNNLPPDFTPCGGNCPPPVPPTLPIALPSTLFNGSDVCCSTFTITAGGQTIQGSYDFKSSALANTTNLALDNALFANFADPNVYGSLYPVFYHL